MHHDPLHRVVCPPHGSPASRTTLIPQPSTSEAPKVTGFLSEREAISDFISKLRSCAIAFASLPEPFFSALAALTRQPMPLSRQELYELLRKDYNAESDPRTQSAPANTSPPLQIPSSSRGFPVHDASSPFRVPPLSTPTTGDCPSTGAVPLANVTASRFALEYFRLEATCEDMPPVIGSGDFASLMNKLVGLVKIGYAFKFFPQRCRDLSASPPGEGIILRKNENGTYQVQLDNGQRPQLKPWEIVEIA